MGANKVFLFLSATFVIVATPGPAVLFVVSKSIEQGFRAGLASTVGLAVGGFLHVLLAVLGFATLLKGFPALYQALQLVGAFYLIYLGLSKMVEHSANSKVPVHHRNRAPETTKKIFLQGFFVQAFNPKVVLFFLSFFPQFIDAGTERMSLQSFYLGCIFVLMTILVNAAYASFAGISSERLERSGVLMQKWIPGITYFLLGLLAVISRT